MTRLGHPVQNLAPAVLIGGEIHIHCFEECGVYVCVYVCVSSADLIIAHCRVLC